MLIFISKIYLMILFIYYKQKLSGNNFDQFLIEWMWIINEFRKFFFSILNIIQFWFTNSKNLLGSDNLDTKHYV